MEDELGEFKISKKVREKLKDRKWVKEELAKGRAAQDILEFSDETMAKFYGAAYRLFEHRRYIDAANAFLFLVTLNAYNHDYWLGLGMATQMTGDFEAAIDSYEMAAICELENPIPYFYLAKCLFAMHERDSALEALDLALEYSDGKSEFNQMRREAQAARVLLMKHG